MGCTSDGASLVGVRRLARHVAQLPCDRAPLKRRLRPGRGFSSSSAGSMPASVTDAKKPATGAGSRGECQIFPHRNFALVLRKPVNPHEYWCPPRESNTAPTDYESAALTRHELEGQICAIESAIITQSLPLVHSVFSAVSGGMRSRGALGALFAEACPPRSSRRIACRCRQGGSCGSARLFGRRIPAPDPISSRWNS